MPRTQIFDGNGDGMLCSEYHGTYYPPGPVCDLDLVLPHLLDLHGRDDDVVILTYPKSGTHWVWEICNMLTTGEAKITEQTKVGYMMEFNVHQTLNKLPSVRLLNTHVKPELYPRDLIHKKAKIIYMLRNPKDVAVSQYFHWSKMALMEYKGTWDGYFQLLLDKNNIFGSWFDYVKSWDVFFKQNPDIPVLQLYFEDFKQDLRSGVKKVSDFLGVDRDDEFIKEVTNQCRFENMKKLKPVPQRIEWMKKVEVHPIFRKGSVGDWKNYFTVAQNEAFNKKYEREMKGFSFRFDSYI